MVQIRSRVSSSYFPPQVGHSIPGRGFRPSVLDVEQGIGTMASGWQTRQPNLEETTTMYRPTVAEIDLTAIRDNLRAIRACIPLKAQVIGIVKADAYGHGAARVAAVLEQEQVRLLAVATPDEAVELRESGIMAEILVFGHSPADFVPYAVTNNVALTTVNRATTAMYGAAAGMHTVRLHYKVDTGMGRAGVLVDDATEQILRSAAVPNVSIVGLYSHLSLIHISEPTRLGMISYAVFCLKKKKTKKK